MNITVNVDDVTMATLVREASEYRPEGKTIGEEVARLALEQIVHDHDGWNSITNRVHAIRDEEVREAVRPLITEALTRPVRKTNPYGEAIGEETTLSAIIADEARKFVTERGDYGRGQSKLEKVVAEEVAKAFKDVVADEVSKARAMVADQIGAQVAEHVKAAMKR